MKGELRANDLLVAKEIRFLLPRGVPESKASKRDMRRQLILIKAAEFRDYLFSRLESPMIVSELHEFGDACTVIVACPLDQETMVEAMEEDLVNLGKNKDVELEIKM
jgi:hypothetical protein